MEVRTGSLFFPALRGSGPRTATQAIVFPREVLRAVAGLTGYSAGFSGDDHHLGRLQVGVGATVNANVVEVSATFGLRDWSGDWDDNYTGTVLFSVLADLQSPTAPPPRTDMAITDFEIIQATQHFRSANFLDLPNVGPDNSIRLIARKDTAVRVYVDYDVGSSTTPVTSLSGELEVETSIGSTTLTLSPLATITPREDAQIDRRQAGHTLNFRIPEAWCQGELLLRCRVFDAAAPPAKSYAFTKNVRFDDVAPLRLYGVGVHYTGQGLDLAAPTQAAVQSTMGWVEKTYPVGEVLLTGYAAIDFDEDMKADIKDGCGDGFEELLDELRDMRGSSSDVYYAVLPSGGIDSGNVGGCGGGGVGAGFTGGGVTAAQEIGHAFGRDHAPCDSATRCGNPSDEDDDYPQYNSFPSDSIGEIGFDPATNQTFDPMSTFDFMGYSSPSWVSPYTYTKLMGSFPSSSGLSGSASAMRMLRAGREGAVVVDRPPPGGMGEWRRVEVEQLFLRLTVRRDGSVRRRPSFHYPALGNWPRGRKTDLELEIHDENGKTLSCRPLHAECKHCPPDCWPKRIRDVVPMPSGARKLVVVRGDDVLYEEDIPEPPEVEVRCGWDEQRKEFEVRWNAEPPGGGGDEENEEDEKKKDDLWYLVQWLDVDGSWRGVAPRTRERSIRIAPRQVGFRGKVEVRVLATSGIATGVGTCTLEGAVEPPPVEVVLTADPTAGPVPSGLVRVSAVDAVGRTVADPEVRWYDEAGAEIAVGRTLDLRSLPEGEHVVRAVVPDLGAGIGEGVFRLEVGPAGECRRCEVVSQEAAPGRDVHVHEGPGAIPPHRPPVDQGPEQKGRAEGDEDAD